MTWGRDCPRARPRVLGLAARQGGTFGSGRPGRLAPTVNHVRRPGPDRRCRVPCGAGPVCEPASRSLAGRSVCGRVRRRAEGPAQGRSGRAGNGEAGPGRRPGPGLPWGGHDGRAALGGDRSRGEPVSRPGRRRQYFSRGGGRHCRNRAVGPARAGRGLPATPGRLGAGLDRVVLHRVATATMRTLLDTVAKTITDPPPPGGGQKKPALARGRSRRPGCPDRTPSLTCSDTRRARLRQPCRRRRPGRQVGDGAWPITAVTAWTACTHSRLIGVYSGYFTDPDGHLFRDRLDLQPGEPGRHQ